MGAVIGMIGFFFRVVFRMLRRLVVPALFLAAGWYGGAKLGAPDLVLRAADGLVARAETMLAPLFGRSATVAGDLAAEGVERGGALAQQGGEYVVGTVEQMLKDLAEPAQEDAPGDGPAGSAPSDDGTHAENAPPSRTADRAADRAADQDADRDALGRDIVLCPGMSVSNAPRARNWGGGGGGGEKAVARAGASVSYKGVDLLLMPATGSCLSSGYGTRNGRLHKGVDYYPRGGGGEALAAADGVIIKAVARSDYGNMLVLDHGDGVYTLYAHLARFGSAAREGASVRQGEALGPIGSTGASSVVHLHWEVLSGEWSDAAGPFGLNPINPFAL